ncbi:MAG: hypothetical protein K8S25_14955 [Alphaproteobacteria bacterium]|nr:hypothetical protein [Alphaproteobacteria bacterium]
MTTSTYALILSVVAILISLAGLGWNVWQKFIFVRPVLQVTFGVWNLATRTGDLALPSGQKLLVLSVTNMGPGPVALAACIIRGRRRSYRGKAADTVNPIYGDPTDENLTSLGPASPPVKIDAAETKDFYFPYGKDCFLAEEIARVGISDTYFRNTWCRRSDIAKAYKAYRRDFGNAEHPARANI